MSEFEPKLSDEEARNLVGKLFDKLAHVKRIGQETGKGVGAAEEKVQKQISSVIKDRTIKK